MKLFDLPAEAIAELNTLAAVAAIDITSQIVLFIEQYKLKRYWMFHIQDSRQLLYY